MFRGNEKQSVSASEELFPQLTPAVRQGLVIDPSAGGGCLAPSGSQLVSSDVLLPFLCLAYSFTGRFQRESLIQD